MAAISLADYDAVPIWHLGSYPFFGKGDGWLISSLENQDTGDNSFGDSSVVPI
ncbi:hypothetical protein H6G97_10990 [Nostoc flagelliforme FACHB-838]|uniref:Uncharacterized protein n=1 Tax=Nostoc flagelliforme FACHB-838 TaxID=2692904 RepID=A0ABR8DMA9_9NOSO|nr:hypothetical protein [Nostoc flagelliforme FACHB-838]